MTILYANTYRLANGKWKFGGILIGDEISPELTEYDSLESFEIEEDAKTMLVNYAVSKG